MSASTSMSLMRPNQRADGMQLVRGSLNDPGVGRTMHQAYSRVGKFVEARANRAAHRWGRGPSATAERIEAYFGTGQHREDKLEALRTHKCPWLEDECSKLMKYSLPCETARTQVQTFTCIVTIATRYHGTRDLFLQSKHLQRTGNTETTISAVWARADDTQSHEWDHYCRYAAACLSETQISAILRKIPARCFGIIDSESSGLGVIERLLIASERNASSISDALAQRYLAGILELPSFWRGGGLFHMTVFNKILGSMLRVLNDLALDIYEAEAEHANDIDFDHQGIDFMASAILVGVPGCGWSMTDTKQHCYISLAEIVRLLRLPRAESLLPMSATLATGDAIENIIPTTVPNSLQFDILMRAEHDSEIPHTNAGHIDQRSVGEVLNDPVRDLGFLPKLVYTQSESASPRWMTHIGDFLRARRWRSDSRESAAVEARTGIASRLRSVLSRLNRHENSATSSDASVHNSASAPPPQQIDSDGMSIQMSGDSNDSEDGEHPVVVEIRGEDSTAHLLALREETRPRLPSLAETAMPDDAKEISLETYRGNRGAESISIQGVPAAAMHASRNGTVGKLKVTQTRDTEQVVPVIKFKGEQKGASMPMRRETFPQQHYRVTLNNVGQVWTQPVRYIDNETRARGIATWTAVAYVNDKECGSGQGKSKSAARERAAKRALIKLKVIQAE